MQATFAALEASLSLRYGFSQIVIICVLFVPLKLPQL